jgi:hypothetical protein
MIYLGMNLRVVDTHSDKACGYIYFSMPPESMSSTTKCFHFEDIDTDQHLNGLK